jgi:ribosomal protein S18 acetylase RimI-like enzyme
MDITVQALTAARWPDLETLFAARGCAVARHCWCMYYRHSGRLPPLARGDTPAARNRRALQALAAQDPPPGLIGYRGAEPVGWIALGPREGFARLVRSPVMKPVDERPVWSIVCFVVPSAQRRQGVVRALLDGAVAYAARRGVALLEAYPVDREVAPGADAPWFGSLRLFDGAGFTEVARRRPARPVVRLALQAPAPARPSSAS